MKKLFMLAALLAIVFCGKAQNVQLHYDFGGALYDKDGSPDISWGELHSLSWNIYRYYNRLVQA